MCTLTLAGTLGWVSQGLLVVFLISSAVSRTSTGLLGFSSRTCRACGHA
jgi:hypothetical protein